MKEQAGVSMRNRKHWKMLLGFFLWLWLLTETCGVCFCARPEEEGWVKKLYNEDNGLPTGEANAVLQTSDGLIWIGSYGGLIRFDGRDFRNYSVEDNHLESSSIRALFEDSRGRLFVGTNDMGVYIFEGNDFTPVPCHGETNPFYSVRSFTEASDGTVYVGTTFGAAMIPSDGEPELIPVEGSEGHVIYGMDCDQWDRVWGNSDNGTVLEIKNGGECRLHDSGEWMEEECYSLLVGSDGWMYMGTTGSRVVRLRLTEEGCEKGTAEYIDIGNLHTVNGLYEDQDGFIWVLAGDGLGYMGENGDFRVPPVMTDAVSLNSMVQDYEGNLWAASTKAGVIYYFRGKYTNFNYTSGLENRAVNAVEAYDGFYYVGTDQGLVILDENYAPVKNDLTEKLKDCKVRHISHTQDGMVYFSLYGAGMAAYDTKSEKCTVYTTREGLVSDMVRMTLPLSDGTLAVAGTGGIDILKEGRVIRTYGEKELPYPFILCMVELKDGTLAAGSDGMGIYTIKDSEVEHYYKEENLESGVVMRMTEDPEAGGIWISAGNSLYFWGDDGIRKMPVHTGTGSIFDIRIVKDQLWLMKSLGVVVVNKADVSREDAEVRELSDEYGLTGTLVANSWNQLFDDGNLWICTNNGISVINTENMPVNSVPPRSCVIQVNVDDKEYSMPSRVTVPASARRITLDLAVMSYTPAEKRVTYWLEGFDDHEFTLSVDGDSSVSYTNLAGGDYVFHYNVYNEDGVKGSTSDVVIHKEYQLWEREWFLPVMILLGIGVIGLFYRMIYSIKVRSYKKRQEEYRSITVQALRTFAHAIDAKDKDTNGHSIRVADSSRELARRMNLSEDEQEKIYYMALLHDIGKIGIPDSILKKQGKLTEEEWEEVRSHPVIGGRILSNFTAIPGIADGARYHHEFYNGEGYCEGLKGEEIPLLARIIAVADAYDAMCSKRYYHEENSMEYARQEFVRCSGTQFDPRVAQLMVSMIDDGFMEAQKKRMEVLKIDI